VDIQKNRIIWSEKLYVVLAGIFIASLVASNLIFQKFFIWQPFYFLNSYNSISWLNSLSTFSFEISVGILPYPITFLVTDIISEIYGRKKANQVVIAGFLSSVFILGVVTLANFVPATDWSPIDNQTFSKVFGLFGPAVFASMTAYLSAQLIDVRIFHFWKKLTNNRHLWLRNNGSTIFSQLVDTFAVLFLLCSLGTIAWDKFSILFFNGFLFKVLVAFIDTPLFYIFSYYIRKVFGLKLGEELI
tara:strand:+ start:1475 stop:2209 length:735 start_codon:yes stop_codon:yes gene_type:complete